MFANGLISLSVSIVPFGETRNPARAEKAFGGKFQPKQAGMLIPAQNMPGFAEPVLSVAKRSRRGLTQPMGMLPLS